MAKPKSMHVYYGIAAITGPQAAAFALHDVVILSGNYPNLAANVAAIKAARPACKVVTYYNFMDVGLTSSSAPVNYRQQASVENWLLRRNPASSATSTLLTSYNPGNPGKGYNVNPMKVGPNSGLRPGVWYARNVMSTMTVPQADGVFVDVSSPYATMTFESLVDASASGTSTAGTNSTTIADGGKAWTVNGQVARIGRMTSGAAAGKIFWVASNTATALTTDFAISPAPSAGDTYELYNTGAISNFYSAVDADYLENGTFHNNDSIRMGQAWANALAEALQEIVIQRPTTNLVLFNVGDSADNKALRALNRDIFAPYVEGVIGTTYQRGWRPAMTIMRNLVRQYRAPIGLNCHPTNTTDWVQARYAMAASMMGGGYLLLSPAGSYSLLTPMRLDEHEIDFGVPVDLSPAVPNADGTFSQRWSAGHIVANPTTGTVVVAVPSGFRRILASSYGNQDATLNNGSTTSVSLPTKTAVMFVPI